MLLKNRTAIITGASSGIGRAAALLFAAEGARIVAVARRENELDHVVAAIAASGGEARAVAGDVRDDATHARAVEAAEQLGGLDIAFNNAGALGEMGPAEGVSLAGWSQTLEANLTSGFLAAKHQLPRMLARRGGSLIFTSTFVGHILGFPGMAAYGAAKAGLIGLMRVLAVETASRGVRVNALLPGGVDTPMGRKAASTPDALAFVAGLHAMKRVASAEEIARSALYLASDLSSFVTGSTLVVDGGISMNRV